MAVPIKKGVEYNCPMFEVRCNQPCVSDGVMHMDECPYDNYNSKKGVKTMASNKPTQKPNPPANNGNNQNNGNSNGGFTPTFRRYADMTPSEQAAFKQGAKTSENKVKERLGFIKPRE